MRPPEQTIKTVRDLQASCLDRGFHQGRAYQIKSKRDSRPDAQLSAADELDLEAATKAAKAAIAEAEDLLETIRQDLNEAHELIRLTGGDLL